jgi:DNA-binding beta-propeller fold protein YncE
VLDAPTPRPGKLALGGWLAGCVLCLASPATPQATSASPAREYLYVANTLGGDLSIVEIPSHRVVGTIPASVVGNSPDDVISSRDGGVLYISRLDTKDVIAVSTATERVLWRAEVGGVPNHLTLSRDERFLFVPLYDKGQLAVVDTRSHQVVARPEVGKGAHGTLLGPHGRSVYVGMMEANQVAVVDAQSHVVQRTIPLPEGVRPFQVDRDETTLYAQLSKLHGFAVVDLKSGRVARTVELPTLGQPVPRATLEKSHYVMNHGLGITPDGKRLVANASLMGFVALYALPDLKLLGTIPVGREPNWVAFSRDGRFAYVSNRRDNTVSVISIAEAREVTRVAAGEFPQRMTVALARRGH